MYKRETGSCYKLWTHKEIFLFYWVSPQIRDTFIEIDSADLQQGPTCYRA